MKKNSAQVKNKRGKVEEKGINLWLGNLPPVFRNPAFLFVVGGVILAALLQILFLGTPGGKASDFVSTKEATRVGAFQRLTKMDDKTKAGIAAKMVPYLRDKSATVRFLALDTIGSLHADAKDMVPELVKVLKGDKEPSIQEKAGLTIGYIGTAAVNVVPELIKDMKDPNPGVRTGAAAGLCVIGANSKESLETLVVGLKDENPEVRVYSMRAIANICDQIHPNPEDIFAALKDQNDSVRANALTCIGKMKVGSARVFKTALTFFKGDNSVDVKIQAALVLGGMGAGAAEAVPTLQAALNDQNPGIRATAAAALGQIGAAARDAVPGLIKLLDDKETWIAQKAAESLEKIGGNQASEAVAKFKGKK